MASGAGAACSARESPGPEVRERSGGALCGHGHLPELPVPGLHSLQAWKDRACRDCVGQASRSRYLRALQSGRGHPSLASCWALAKHRNESHHRPLIRLPTAGRGPRVPAQCLPSTLREARAPGPCAGVSAPCLPPDLGPPGSADPAPRICRPRAARVDAPGGGGRPCGRPACVAEQCSALSRVITASALGRQLGTGLRDVCE